MATQPENPFLRLPAELRNTIYELYLASFSGYYTPATSSPSDAALLRPFDNTASSSYTTNDGPLGPTSLLLVARQVYDDAYTVALDTLTFYFAGEDAILDFVEFHQRRETARYIQHVIYDCTSQAKGSISITGTHRFFRGLRRAATLPELRTLEVRCDHTMATRLSPSELMKALEAYPAIEKVVFRDVAAEVNRARQLRFITGTDAISPPELDGLERDEQLVWIASAGSGRLSFLGPIAERMRVHFYDHWSTRVAGRLRTLNEAVAVRLQQAVVAIQTEEEKEEGRYNFADGGDGDVVVRQTVTAPSQMFMTADYSEWDNEGVPRKDARGRRIPQKKMYALYRQHERQKDLYDRSLAE
ncbi:Uu.00g082330.m01.CDS01 [Anthostomella pinea]|uniref:Uu.00g082330.m01.CDS01 n=1 Tax=Anthostomella pinea TaxID=933095 RepID=A0AAI8VM15_9PEZI|nr:Uu.00g082330.m01.CDS01 [Anthostomella pinea]